METNETNKVDPATITGGFRERLYALRRKNNWSQSDLARKVWGETVTAKGYVAAKNRDRISAYEAGRAVPERSNLDAIAAAFGVAVSVLAPDLVLAHPSWGGSVPGAGGVSQQMEMRVVPGTGDAHIKVDAIVPFSVASKIVALLSPVLVAD